MTHLSRSAVACVVLAVIVYVAAKTSLPACTRPCVNLPGVSQEVQTLYTDEGQTCKLDPKFHQCILDECQTDTLPQEMVDHLKENYDCDLSSAPGIVSPYHLVTIVTALLLALLLTK